MSVYMILSYDVFDQKRFAQYRAAAALMVPQFNGKILASQPNPSPLNEKKSPDHMTLVEFETLQDVEQMQRSDLMNSVMALRVESAETDVHMLFSKVSNDGNPEGRTL